MANRFWVGGTATWDGTAGTKWATTSGGGGGAAVPTAADDVFFDGSSGVGTITTSGTTTDVCRSLNCTGFGGTLNHAGGTVIAIGDGTAGASNIALKLVSGMGYTAGGRFDFVSTSATVQTIDTGGKQIRNVTINGSGGSWQLTSSLNNGATSTITQTTGTLDTNGQSCSWGSYSSSGSLARTLTMGSSAITITGTGTSWTCSTNTNMTITTNTATITFTGANVTMIPGSASAGTGTPTGDLRGASIVASGSGQFTENGGTGSGLTCASFTRTGTAVNSDSLALAGPIVCTSGTVTINGNSPVNRLRVFSNTFATSKTITAATTSLSNANFRDITGAGGAAWTGTSLGDALGNSGITFDAPTDQTWNGNTTGNWSTAANWTSRVPLPQDNALINGLTSGTITMDMFDMCANLDCTGSTGGTITATNVSNIHGSVTLANGMTYSGSGGIQLLGRSAGLVFAQNGATISKTITFTGPGSTYTVNGNLNTTATGGFTLSAGTLIAEDITINALTFTSTGSLNRSASWVGSQVFLSGTTSVINISGFGASQGTWDASNSTWYITDISASNKTIIPGGSNIRFYNVTISGGSTDAVVMNTGVGQTWNIDGTLTIGAPKTITFHAGFTYTLGQLVAIGTSGNLITLQSDTAGTQFILRDNSGTVSADYLSIQDSAATGNALWYAGRHSINVSNNTGWIFTDAPTSLSLTLNSQTIKTPNSLREMIDSQYTQNRVLLGSIKRKYYGTSKRAWELTYNNLNQTDYVKLKTIYENYLATNSLLSLELTGTAYDSVDTEVHMDMEQIQFPATGINYLSSFKIVLREA